MPPPASPVITSRTNARVKELRASLSGAARRPGDLLGLEGENLLREAHQQGHSFETLYLREDEEAQAKPTGWLAEVRASQTVILSREVFDSAVSTSSPQGLAATWRIQEPAPASRQDSAAPGHRQAECVLVVEDLQDPGNLGTLIRSLAAFGMARMYATPETVNPWNPKVVRSAAGAIFQTAVRRLPLETIVRELQREGLRLFAAVSSDSESPGPAHRPAASLSYNADFVPPCAVLIGNEGAGLSARARALADEEVLIPCRVESLNAAVAGSVLLYEVMRQRTLRAGVQAVGKRV